MKKVLIVAAVLLAVYIIYKMMKKPAETITPEQAKQIAAGMSDEQLQKELGLSPEQVAQFRANKFNTNMTVTK